MDQGLRGKTFLWAARRFGPAGMMLGIATCTMACGAAEVVSLQLEIRPWTSPTAVYLRLDSPGYGDRVLFSPASLTVLSRQSSGANPPESQAEWLQVPSHLFASGRAEVEEGDLVSFEIESPDGSLRRSSAPRQRLTESARRWLEGLLADSEGWPTVAVAPSYLRAEILGENRMVAIRRRGKIVLLDLANLPAPVRAVARQATAEPGTFVPIDPAVADRVRALAQHGAELLVSDDDRGFTLTPYRGQTAEAVADPTRR